MAHEVTKGDFYSTYVLLFKTFAVPVVRKNSLLQISAINSNISQEKGN